jgi:Mg-chelatase subunit ChlD
MAPHQVIFVLDTSWSMSWDGSLDRAKAAMLALLASMDPWVGQVGLVTFNDGAALAQPLSGDLSAMQAHVAAVEADGDTRYGAGIELARLELQGERGEPGARRTIVIITDGGVKDDPAPAIAAARAAGIEFLVLAYPNSFPAPGILQLLQPLFGDPERILFDIGPGRIEQTAERLRDWIDMPGLFETIQLRDEVPPAFRVVPGSIQPPPSDFDGRTITWDLGPVAAKDGIRLEYRLTALAEGWQDTNVFADASYRDALGNDARFTFPVPRVEVYVPTATPTASATPTPSATLTPSPSPTPPVYHSYLPLLLVERNKAQAAPADILLVIDRSSSMRGAKLEAARAAAARFVDLVDLGHSRVAILQFDVQTEILSELTGDAAVLHRALDRLEIGSGTRIDRALDSAAALIDRREDLARAAVVVLLTDGLQVVEPEGVEPAAARLAAAGVARFFIGLGADLDAAALLRWSGASDRFFAAPDASDLRAIYEAIARAIPCAAADYWGRRCR